MGQRSVIPNLEAVTIICLFCPEGSDHLFYSTQLQVLEGYNLSRGSTIVNYKPGGDNHHNIMFLNILVLGGGGYTY